MRTEINLSISVLIILICTGIIIYSCKKEVIKVVPFLAAAYITNISTGNNTTVRIMTSDVIVMVTARVVCWITNQNLTILDNKTYNETDVGIFTSSTERSNTSHTFFVRAYTNYLKDDSYSIWETFTRLV